MKCLIDSDYVRDENGIPLEKGLGSWISFGNKLAKRMSKKNIIWHSLCFYVEHRDCARISFGSQPYNIMTGN